ncbi:hypothetical protein L0337_04190 [candidate division KSB1 bacterium]|nr:hypothetical protein [candidate division KSB1 bacterium]
MVTAVQTGLWLREDHLFMIAEIKAGASNAELVLSVLYKNGSLVMLVTSENGTVAGQFGFMSPSLTPNFERTKSISSCSD